MTTREQQCVKAILQALHEADGGQRAAITLHTEANLICPQTRTEFDRALALADGRRWVTGVKARHGSGFLYNLNDAGEAALLEL